MNQERFDPQYEIPTGAVISQQSITLSFHEHVLLALQKVLAVKALSELLSRYPDHPDIRRLIEEVRSANSNSQIDMALTKANAEIRKYVFWRTDDLLTRLAASLP